MTHRVQQILVATTGKNSIRSPILTRSLVNPIESSVEENLLDKVVSGFRRWRMGQAGVNAGQRTGYLGIFDRLIDRSLDT